LLGKPVRQPDARASTIPQSGTKNTATGIKDRHRQQYSFRKKYEPPNPFIFEIKETKVVIYFRKQGKICKEIRAKLDASTAQFVHFKYMYTISAREECIQNIFFLYVMSSQNIDFAQ
jgi:hypothetical protein